MQVAVCVTWDAPSRPRFDCVFEIRQSPIDQSIAAVKDGTTDRDPNVLGTLGEVLSSIFSNDLESTEAADVLATFRLSVELSDSIRECRNLLARYLSVCK